MDYILSRPDIILRLLGQHLFMTVTALLISTSIALPLSMVLLRSERAASAVLGVLGVLYTIPSIALLILLLPLFGLNQNSVIVALVLYTQIILVRNMVAGLRSVPAATLEAATGVGMSSWQRWYRVQLPLALPVILAGFAWPPSWPFLSPPLAPSLARAAWARCCLTALPKIGTTKLWRGRWLWGCWRCC